MVADYSLYYFLVLLVLLFYMDINHNGLAESLQCYYCYNADLQEDCFWNTQKCRAGQICGIDTTKLTYVTGKLRDHKVTIDQYKMGCLDTIVCKDGFTHGPGPYGYKEIYRECCCTDKCTEGDETGQGFYHNCPNAFENITDITNSASSILTGHQTGLWVHSVFVYYMLILLQITTSNWIMDL